MIAIALSTKTPDQEGRACVSSALSLDGMNYDLTSWVTIRPSYDLTAMDLVIGRPSLSWKLLFRQFQRTVRNPQRVSVDTTQRDS